MDYPDPDDEAKILVTRTGIDLRVAKKMVSVATKVREAQANESTMANISPRRLIMWAALAQRMDDPRKAAKFTLTNRLSDDDATFVDGIVQRYFGGEV
jgi:MoxR-like ATPase